MHHTSGHPMACPVRALQRRVSYLRAHRAPPDTPITAIKVGADWVVPKSSQLTAMLRRAVGTIPSIGYTAQDVSPRSLRSGGAMALLLSGEDKLVIQMMGRWKSDAIFTYLHSTALPLIKNHSMKMLRHGKFTVMNPNITLESATDILDNEFLHDDPAEAA